MAIRDIFIDKFSVFDNFKLDFCDGINVIIGNNGTGKTQLLKFLYALHESSSESYMNKNKFSNLTKTDDTPFFLPSAVRLGFIEDCFRLYVPYNRLQQNSIVSDKETILLLTTFDNITHEISLNPSGDTNIIFSDNKQTHSKNSVFIPAKEMLSHASLLSMSEVFGDNMPYDVTYLKIIELARRWKLNETPSIANGILKKLEKVMGGYVVVKDDGSFWMQGNSEAHMIPFANEADGLKRFGLLWQLLKNGSLNENTVLFWDEPENSVNPQHIPIIVDIMLELQRKGVQIIFTTHNYHFMNYLNVKKEKTDSVKFISLKKDHLTTVFESAEDYSELSFNSIVDGELKMYDDELIKGFDV